MTRVVLRMRYGRPQKFIFAVNILAHASGRVRGLESRIRRLYDIHSRFCAPKSNNDRFVRKLQFPTPPLFFDVAPRYIELSRSSLVCE